MVYIKNHTWGKKDKRTKVKEMSISHLTRTIGFLNTSKQTMFSGVHKDELINEMEKELYNKQKVHKVLNYLQDIFNGKLLLECNTLKNEKETETSSKSVQLFNN